MLKLAIYDIFQLILETVIDRSAIRRTLEATQRLKKRLVRIARSYTASIGTLSNQRDPILVERLNLNIRSTTPLYTPSTQLVDIQLNDTQVARRNSDPQRLIQQQSSRHVTAAADSVLYYYSKGCKYSKYTYLATKQVYTTCYKYKGNKLYVNRYGTLTQRPATTTLQAIPIPRALRALALALALILVVTNNQFVLLLQ